MAVCRPRAGLQEAEEQVVVVALLLLLLGLLGLGLPALPMLLPLGPVQRRRELPDNRGSAPLSLEPPPRS